MSDNKRKSYRQLEKQAEGARVLIHRLAQRCNHYEKTIEALKGQLQSSQAFMGLAILASNEEAKMTVSKELVSNFISNKAMAWEETEDKTAYIITVKEAPKHDEATQTTEESAIEGEEGTDNSGEVSQSASRDDGSEIPLEEGK